MVAAVIGLNTPLLGSVIVYEEDFSSVTLPTATQATLGHYSPFATFGEISVSANATIETTGGNNVLQLFSNSNYRGIGIALDSAMLAGAGTYSVGFNVLSFDFSSTNGQPNAASLEVSVFSADGFVQNSDDGLVMNAQTGDLVATSNNTNAVSTQLATQTINFFDSTNTGQFNLDFEYNGTDDAIVIYLGANNVAWPNPVIQLDDIVVTAVPEPSSLLLIASTSIFFFRRRRA